MAASTTNLRIAVIEDEPLIREMLAQHLEQSGHSVLWTAGSLRRAAARVQTTDPDLVIMDLGLADSRGEADVRKVLGSFPKPVVVWTGYRLASVRRCLDGIACIAGVLRKDVDFAELDRTLAEVAAGRLGLGYADAIPA
jgi:DNA-binding NarL/FixJ family response regulator